MVASVVQEATEAVVELDRQIDRKMGKNKPTRNPGHLSELGPAQRRLRALLWKHGDGDYAAPGLNPLELVDRLASRLKKVGLIKEDGRE